MPAEIHKNGERVMPVQSFRSHTRPQPSGLGLSQRRQEYNKIRAVCPSSCARQKSTIGGISQYKMSRDL
jgi:hypothetical protein